MTMGARCAEAQPQDGEIEWLGEKPWEAAADPDAYPGNDFDGEARAGAASASRLFAGAADPARFGLDRRLRLCARAAPGRGRACRPGSAGRRRSSAPLILIGLAWLIFGRSSRRETRRFTAAVRAMRQESEALEAVLAITATKLAENRAALSEESARLMSLGDEATDRIGRVTQQLGRESRRARPQGAGARPGRRSGAGRYRRADGRPAQGRGAGARGGRGDEAGRPRRARAGGRRWKASSRRSPRAAARRTRPPAARRSGSAPISPGSKAAPERRPSG